MRDIIPDFLNVSLGTDILNPGADTPIIFDTILSSRLNRGLAYSTSTGIITVPGGCVALIIAQVQWLLASAFINRMVLYDRTGAANVSFNNQCLPVLSTQGLGTCPGLFAVVSPAASNTYDIRTVLYVADTDVNEFGTGLSIIMWG